MKDEIAFLRWQVSVANDALNEIAKTPMSTETLGAEEDEEHDDLILIARLALKRQLEKENK